MRGKAVGMIWMAISLSWSLWSCGGSEVREPTEAVKAGAETEEAAPLDEPNSKLFLPSLAREEAPDKFQAEFETTKGTFVVEIIRDWSPRGASRFYNLVKIGYFDDVAFYRSIEDFMVQFGVSGNPEITAQWANATIKDDPVRESNKRGTLTYAKSGADSRTTQLFINLVDNVNLDAMGFSPIGQVVEGMSVVDSLYTGYGELAPQGKGPSYPSFYSRGNEYLRADFPNLDYIKKIVILDG